ncbi:hypothetical protein Tco_1533176 [Tanacetum coccineum]
MIGLKNLDPLNTNVPQKYGSKKDADHRNGALAVLQKKGEVGTSYVSVVNGVTPLVQPGNSLSSAPALVLDEECVVERDFSNCAMGRVKSFDSITKLQSLLVDEGFVNVTLSYLGGLWVMFECDKPDTKRNLMKKSCFEKRFYGKIFSVNGKQCTRANKDISADPFVLNDLLGYRMHVEENLEPGRLCTNPGATRSLMCNMKDLKGVGSLDFRPDKQKSEVAIEWCRNELKAYGLGSLDFLLDVLEAFGFGSTWCTWIRGISDFAKASLLVNGSPSDEFHIHRGLKQVYRIFGLSHLFYADDAFFMGEWSDNNLRGCTIMENKFRYLGVMVGAGMTRHKAWDDGIFQILGGGLKRAGLMDTSFGGSVRGGARTARILRFKEVFARVRGVAVGGGRSISSFGVRFRMVRCGSSLFVFRVQLKVFWKERVFYVVGGNLGISE